MSGVKTTVLVIGLFVVVAVALVGASSYVASSSKDSNPAAAGCAGHEKEVAATSNAASGCGRTASATRPCATTRVSGGTDRDCPVSASCPVSKTGCSKACGSKPSRTAKIETIEGREGKVVVLTGRYVCGTCELGMETNGKQCQPAFRARDGKNYLLSRNNLSERLRTETRDKDVKISSRVKKLDGVKYLEVEVIRAAS